MKHLSLLTTALVVSFAPNGALAEETARVVAITEARAAGVRPEAAAMVTRQMYATAARLGVRVVAETETASAARFSPGGATPAELLDVAVRTHADHALAATLGSHDDRYVVTVVVANADRTGPFTRTAEAGAAELETTVDGMTRALLPASALIHAEPTKIQSDSEADPSDPGGKVSLAVQTEGAIGVTRRGFYNHLAGARLDYSFPGGFACGVYAGYVNAKGKDGRVSNVLTALQLEYRAAVFGKASGWRLPLRFAGGYLPNNGPTLRFAAGVSAPLGDSARLTLDLLAPTVWIVKDSTVVSMDVAAEVSFDL